MGNCQAIDNASLVIQHQNGRVERLYAPITAHQVMKLNPGHCVALLLATTLHHSTTTSGAVAGEFSKRVGTSSNGIATTTTTPVRVTRIKLLRPNDVLNLGYSYRLITNQEVMKGLWAKKQSEAKKKQCESGGKPQMKEKEVPLPECSAITTPIRSDLNKSDQAKKSQKHRSSTSSRSRNWHPSLNSISEATG